MNTGKLLTICLLLLTSSLSRAESPPAIKIGVLLPLSGSYAAVGADNRQGIEAALDVSRSSGLIDLIYSDSRADAATAVSEFRKLSDSDQVLAVFAMRGPVGMAVNPLSLSTGIPLFGGVGNKDFASSNKYAFQFWSKSDDEGAFLAKKLQEQNFKKVAVLTGQDDWPISVSQGMRQALSKSATKIVYDQEIIPSETNFHTILLRMKSLSPDVIFANLGVAQIGPFLRQAKEQNISTPIYSNFWAAKKDVMESAGAQNIEGVKFIEMDTALPTLREIITTKFSSTPSGATLSSYMGILLLTQAISSNPKMQTSADLYTELIKQTEIRTPDGRFPIKDRCVQFPLVEKIIRNGKAETIKEN